MTILRKILLVMIAVAMGSVYPVGPLVLLLLIATGVVDGSRMPAGLEWLRPWHTVGAFMVLGYVGYAVMIWNPRKEQI